MIRRLILSLSTVLVVACSGIAPAAEATVAGHGNLSFTIKIPHAPATTCIALAAVQLRVSGTTYFLHESTLAGQNSATPPVCVPGSFAGRTNAYPTTRLCTPAGGVVAVTGALTISGSTYTIKSPYTTCSGKNVTDTIVMTVGSTTVTYKHDFIDFDGTEIHITGTLSRVL